MARQKPHVVFSQLIAFAAAAAAASATPILTVPRSAPTDASEVVDRDFAGFAFEQASLSRYALDDQGNPNQFSKNLIAEVTRRTGGRPLIRLGGTSADYAKLLPGQAEPALPVAELSNFQDVGGTTIGPSYWGLGRVFDDALYIIQTPLAVRNISESVAWAKSVVEHLGIDRIHSFEPGNEPDLYPASGLGPPEYQGKLTNETYVGNFTRYAAAIAEAVSLPTSRFFQAFDTAWHVDDPGAGSRLLNVAACFSLGLDDASIVKTVAHHYYQTGVGHAGDLQGGLMNHSATAAGIDLVVHPAVEWLRAHQPDVPFVFSEVGNSLNPLHDYAYQAVLGAALWLVDFQLYGLAAGVRRFNLQQIMHAGYDMWLPVASEGVEPHVMANFYALPFVADFVGDSGVARVSQVDVDGGGNADGDDDGNVDEVVAYAVYEDGMPRRLAVLNFGFWNGTESRGSQTISVVLPDGVREVQADVLSSPEGAGAGAESITYGGSKWTYESLGKEVKGVRNDSETLAAEGGKVSVTVLQSSAVLLRFLT